MLHQKSSKMQSPDIDV